MTEKYNTFPEEIEFHKSEKSVPMDTVEINKNQSSLAIRLRGCFITDCKLTNPLSNETVSILHSESDKSVAKLTASHIMSPVSHNEGVGGHHGYPRWADYHEFPIEDGIDGEKRVSFQAKRSDLGLDTHKVFELNNNSLITDTIITSYEPESTSTSIGEHLYFKLKDEDIDGLLVNGTGLNELLGDEAATNILNEKSYIIPNFSGEINIHFPAEHNIKLSAKSSNGILNMIIWHRKGSESICFEPTVGFSRETGNEGITIPPYGSAHLSTKIELLP